MKLKSLLPFLFIFFLYSCSDSELKINDEPQLDLTGNWKVITLSFSETLQSTINSISSTSKTESVANNSSLIYTFTTNPNELDSSGVFDYETTHENGKKDYSSGVKGIDGIFPPVSWILKGNKIILENKDFTQEIDVIEFTKNSLKLYYVYTRETVNTLNSDTSKKTIVFNLTLERV